MIVNIPGENLASQLPQLVVAVLQLVNDLELELGSWVLVCEYGHPGRDAAIVVVLVPEVLQHSESAINAPRK